MAHLDDKLVYLDETYTLHFPKGEIDYIEHQHFNYLVKMYYKTHR